MTRGVPRRPGALSPTFLVAILIVVGIAVGTALALTRSPTTGGTPTPSASVADVQSSISAPVTATPGTSASSATSVPSAGGSSTIVIDSMLLTVLPASIKGIPLVENADGEAHDLTDPALAGEASALAAALVIDTSTGDFAYVSVVRLRTGVFSDSYFESWRETFDEGACSQAGGVARSSAEADLAGHQTFIGHCVGGILTYHVHLAQPILGDLIVSISAVGEQRFGQLVMEGIR